MKVNKFVLVQKEEGVTEIRLGCVEVHCDLLRENEKCLGGGFFKVKEDKRQVLMWDKSHDFGYPKFGGRSFVSNDKLKGFSFYYLPDLFMPLDDEYKINVEFV